MRPVPNILVLIFLIFTEIAPAFADQYFEKIEIFVPSTPKGGWDQTASVIGRTLISEGLVSQFKIRHSPGGGGLVGLAQFIESQRGQGNVLLIGGMGMVAATEKNKSELSLLDTTLIARLTADASVIAVHHDSGISDFSDLVEAMLNDPSAINWVGGSSGGNDELLLLRLAASLKIPFAKINYRSFPGGGDVAKALVQREFVAGVSGYSELAPFVKDGNIRALAISSEQALPGLDIPTMSELGIDIVATNWRGVFAAPGLSPEQEKHLLLMVGEMVGSKTWHSELDSHWWQNVFLSGAEFSEFVATEQEQASMRTGSFSSSQGEAEISSILGRKYIMSLAIMIVAVFLLIALVRHRISSRNREQLLREKLEESVLYAKENAAELRKVLTGISAHVNDEFESWNLTDAEKDVGMLMLKGLRLKEIAAARGTSERTVRQQAQAVYTKSGIDGRNNLSAYFLEDFFGPMAKNN